MDTSFVTLEYSFNPNAISQEYVFNRLKVLGFALIAYNDNHLSSVHISNNVILLVSKTYDVPVATISSVGLLSDEISTDLEFHQASGGHIYPGGKTTTVLFSFSDAEDPISNNFTLIAPEKQTHRPLFNKIRGIVTDVDDKDFYEYLGFVRYNDQQIMTKDRMFSIVTHDSYSTNAICIDCDDIFAMISRCLAEGIDVISNDNDMSIGSELDYKINAFGCFATGNEGRYNIETCIKEALPNLDIIVRKRRRYYGVVEEFLDYYR